MILRRYKSRGEDRRREEKRNKRREEKRREEKRREEKRREEKRREEKRREKKEEWSIGIAKKEMYINRTNAKPLEIKIFKIISF